MKQQKFYIFKAPGSYIGLFIGFIFSLQIEMNRLFLLEGKRDFGCSWIFQSDFFCSNLAPINIIFFLIFGFAVGGLIQKKYCNNANK